MTRSCSRVAIFHSAIGHVDVAVGDERLVGEIPAVATESPVVAAGPENVAPGDAARLVSAGWAVVHGLIQEVCDIRAEQMNPPPDQPESPAPDFIPPGGPVAVAAVYAGRRIRVVIRRETINHADDFLNHR